MIPSSHGNPRRTRPDLAPGPASAAVLGACLLGLLASCASSHPVIPDRLTAVYRSHGGSLHDETYATALGFREAALRHGAGATEAFQAGATVGSALFNAHLTPPPASSASAPPLVLVLLPTTTTALPPEALLDLMERCGDALRAGGVDARRDAVVSDETMLEPRLRAARPRLLRSEIDALAIDGPEARLDARVWLEDTSGQRLHERRCLLKKHAPAPDPLGPLGASLAACLLGDRGFRDLLGVAP